MLSDDESAGYSDKARGNRSRDKFQRERDIEESNGRAGRDAFGRDLDRRHDPGRRRSPDRDSYSRDRSPSGKRSRRDDGFGPIFNGPQPMPGQGFDGNSFVPMGMPPLSFPGSFVQPPARVPMETLLRGDILLSFKQFLETQDTDIDPEKATVAYVQYKQEFTVRQVQKFFTTHKASDWFQEKYHPNRRKEREQQLRQRAASEAATFISEWQAGQFANLSYDDKTPIQPSANAEAVIADPTGADAAKTESEELKLLKTDDEELDDKLAADIAVIPGVSGPAASSMAKILILKTIPPSFSRQQLEELCKKVTGFVHLELSEVNPQKKFHRVGWAYYEPDVDIQAAFQQLDHSKIESFEFHFSVFNSNLVRTHRVPSIASTPDRKSKDLKLAAKLVAFLDNEKQIEPSFATKIALEDLTPEQISLHLDQLILYLRRVHLFDYYSGSESDSVLSLHRRFGQQPERQHPPKSVNDVTANASLEWEKRLDEQIERRMALYLSEEEYQKLKPKDPEAEVRAGLEERVAKVEEGKYRCSVCSKLFKGTDFVLKHLSLKHEDKTTEIRTEAEMYNNYLRDSNHLLPGSSLLQNSLPNQPGQHMHSTPLVLMPPRSMIPPGNFFPFPGNQPPDMPSQGNWNDDYDGRWDRPGSRGPGRGRPYGGDSFHPYQRGRGRGGIVRDDRDNKDRDDDRRGPRREFNRPQRPPPGEQKDFGTGRAVRSYVDLDAPPADEIMDYRSAGL